MFAVMLFVLSGLVLGAWSMLFGNEDFLESAQRAALVAANQGAPPPPPNVTTPPPVQPPTSSADVEADIKVNNSDGPVSVNRGDTVVVSWTSSGADRCFITPGGWRGTQGSKKFKVKKPVTLYLTCIGEGGKDTDKALIVFKQLGQVDDSVKPTLALAFRASPSAGAYLIYWTSTNAKSCFASDGWKGAKRVPSGEELVYPGTTGTFYQLTCKNSAGEVTKSVTITPSGQQPSVDKPFLNFSASPNLNTPAAATSPTSWTLKWASPNAQWCTAFRGWAGTKAIQGSQIVNPKAKTVYELVCYNKAGSAEKLVTIDPKTGTVDQPKLETPLLDFRILGGQTTGSGKSFVLHWLAKNATICKATGGWQGTKPIKGELLIYPTRTTDYKLTCSGTGGTTTKSVTAEFSTAAPPPVAPPPPPGI